MKVLVVGSGIIGLSITKELRKMFPEWGVILVSASSPETTTSEGAGGLWMPYHCEPEHIVNAWAKQTFDMAVQAIQAKDKTIEMVKTLKLFNDFKLGDPLPSWHNCSREVDYKVLPSSSFSHFHKTLLAYPYVHSFNTPIFNTTKILKQLVSELSADKKVTLLLGKKNFISLTEVTKFSKDNNCAFVVNCTGCGSKELMDDEELLPARGVILVYKRPVGADISFTLESGSLGTPELPAYIIPRGEVIVAGGTFLVNDPKEDISTEEFERISAAAKIFCPLLEGMEPIRTWVGFRPYRKSGVRFDQVEVGAGNNTTVIFNNYGHSGSGWTLHYGAALGTVNMIKAYVDKKTSKM